MQNHQEVNPLMMNGEHSSAVNSEQTTHCENNCLAVDHKPIVDQLVCQNNDANLVKVKGLYNNNWFSIKPFDSTVILGIMCFEEFLIIYFCMLICASKTTLVYIL